jgi:hypothetical protein
MQNIFISVKMYSLMAVSLLCSWVDEQQYSEEHNAFIPRVEGEGGRIVICDV